MQTLTRPVITAQTREWFAQVVVPNSDVCGDRLVDGVVEVLIGDIPVGPGEVTTARAIADAWLAGTDMFVSCVYFHGNDDEF